MTKHMRWAVVGFTALAFFAEARAEGMKGLSVTGSVEGGFAYTWDATPQSSDSQLLVDSAHLNMEANVSETAKVVIRNAFSITPAGAGSVTGGVQNSSKFFSGASVANAGGTFMYSNLGAYLDWKCSSNLHTQVGHIMTPFGIESMKERWDMNSYYYSQGYASAFQTNGWGYDVGLKVAWSGFLPGLLEIALLDGRNGDPLVPTIAARWNWEMKSGESSFTPVISALFGRFSGSPKDVGFTVGAMWQMGALSADLQFLYDSFQAATAGSATKNWSLYLEPGFDMGIANISIKAEYVNLASGAATDFNLGAALSHEYAGGYRVKLAYQHAGLSNAHVNDLRLLFGAKF